MKVFIVIPAHNEENRIERTLREYEKIFKNKKKKGEIKGFEFIVVLNACKDKTIDVVKRLEKSYKEIRHLEFKQGGKGFAIIEGFKYSLKKGPDLIGFVDADMATPPEAFYELIKNIGGYDGIIASRWLKGSIIKTKQTLLRRAMSKCFGFLVRNLLFLPYKDTQCGAKLFKKEALKEVVGELGITKWAFDVDLLYKLKNRGFNIKEIPTVWEDKKESKLNLTKVPFQMFSSVVRLRLLYSPFKFIVKGYDRMPEWVKVHHR